MAPVLELYFHDLDDSSDTEIVGWMNVEFQVALSTKTGASFELLRDNTQVADISPSTPIAIDVAGDTDTARTWWIPVDVQDVVVDDGEEVAEIVRVSLESAERLLESGTVYPSGGVMYFDTPIWAGTKAGLPDGPDRYVGAMDVHYDDSSWSAATQVIQATGAAAPEGWNTPSAWWIGGTGDAYEFRKTFWTDALAVTLLVSCADAGEIWVDGNLIVKLDPFKDEGTKDKVRRIVFDVGTADGWHTIYGWVQKLATSSALLACAVYNVDQDTLLTKTDSSWKQSPVTPAVTPGWVVDQFIDEAQARTAMPLVSPTFDRVDDTAGRAWPGIQGQQAYRVGLDTVLDVVDQLGEGYTEWNMSCAGAFGDLNMWVGRGVVDGDSVEAPGVGTTTSVEYERGVNTRRIAHRETFNIKNVSLIMGRQGMIVGPDDASIADWGRHEVGLSLGQCDGPASIYVAAATLLPISQPETSVEVVTLPTGDTDTPLLGVGLGDWCKVESRVGTLVDHRVMGVIVRQEADDSDVAELTLECDTVREVLAKRHARHLARTNTGTVDGRSRSAHVSTPWIRETSIVQVITDTISHSGVPNTADVAPPKAARRPQQLVRLDVECNVAGAGSSTYAIYKNGSSTGSTVTIAASTLTATAYFGTGAPTWWPGDTYSLRCTTSGGHDGISVTPVWVVMGGH